MYADHSLSMNSVAEEIVRLGPDILGLSIALGSLPYAKEMLDKVNERIPAKKKPLVVLGKTAATYFTEKLLKDYFPSAIAVRGEGELALIDLVEYVGGRRKLENTRNIAYIKNGQFISTTKAIVNLEKLASPDMDEIVRLAKRGGKIYIEASRGCPWGHCLFCPREKFSNAGNNQKRWRARPVKQVLNEINALVHNGVKSFDFADEEFFGPGLMGIKNAKDIAKRIIGIRKENGKGISFNLSCRADSIWNKEDDAYLRNERIKTLRLLKRAGLKKVFLGIESGSITQLKRYNKGLSIEESEMAISMVKDKFKLGLEIGFIMFDPEVVLGEVIENIKFIERNAILENISWFLNILRIQAGALLINKYRKMPEIKLSRYPDLNTLQHSYIFKAKSISKLLEISKSTFDNSDRLYYILKSIFRAGINGTSKEEFAIYMKYRTKLMDSYWETFKKFLKAEKNFAVSIEKREEIYKESTIRSLLKQFKLAEDMAGELKGLKTGNGKIINEVIDMAREFEDAAAEKIANEILGNATHKTIEIIRPRLSWDNNNNINEMVFVLKPGGTFNRKLVSDILRRLVQRGYNIHGIRVFGGEEIKKKDIFRSQHRYAFRVAKEGKKLFSKEDYKKMAEIYNRPEFKSHFGIPFEEIELIPAYELTEKYGLSEEEVIDLWMKGYEKEELFQKGNYLGINKIGIRKYVLISRHFKVKQGKPFLLINGVCIQMKKLSEVKGQETIVFIIRGTIGKSATWKKMREEFLGDLSPLESPEGSIRNDSFRGKMNVTEEVPFWKNIAHLSSGAFEALLEQTLWFQLPMKLTFFGDLLLRNGYKGEEIDYFLTDPTLNIAGVTKPLFDWTEKMDTVEAFLFINKVFPPFYKNSAMATMSFKEYLRYKELHEQGSISIASNIVKAERIKDTSARINECPRLGTRKNREYAIIGNRLIKKGKVAQVLLAGGTAGRSPI